MLSFKRERERVDKQSTENARQFNCATTHGLDLISLLLHDHFQYTHRNEAPAPNYVVVFQLVINKVRRCNEYTGGNTSGTRAV